VQQYEQLRILGRAPTQQHRRKREQVPHHPAHQ
jgi:hypothetical protein